MEEPQYHLQAVVGSGESLADFDGPLDVILQLLRKNQIEIQNLQISVILDQYLAWLEERKEMDLEITSSFVIMASWLVYIKTRMLLSEEEQAEARSEMDLLIQSLETRRRQEVFEQIKKAAQLLEPCSDAGRSMFTRGPEPLPADPTYRYQHSGADLLRAWSSMEERRQRKQAPSAAAFAGIVGAEPFPVAASAAQVIERLLHRSAACLQQLFQGSRSRSELVATFLAVLELSRVESIYLGTDEAGGTTVTWLKMPEERVGEEDTDGTGGNGQSD